MSSTWDILAELDSLIEDDMTKTTPGPIPAPPTRTVPTLGTRVQRSDAQNRRKAAMLLTPPPPPPRGRGRPAPLSKATAPEAPPMVIRKTKAKIRPAIIPASIRPVAAAPPSKAPPPTLLAAAVVRRASRSTEPPPLTVLTISEDSSPPAPSPPAPSSPAPSPPAPSPTPVAVPPPPPSPPPPAAQGPDLPPPITVEYASGHHATVPYFAATVSRQYKLRTASGERFKLRFSAGGRLLSSRKLPPQLPGSPRGE